MNVTRDKDSFLYAERSSLYHLSPSPRQDLKPELPKDREGLRALFFWGSEVSGPLAAALRPHTCSQPYHLPLTLPGGTGLIPDLGSPGTDTRYQLNSGSCASGLESRAGAVASL